MFAAHRCRAGFPYRLLAWAALLAAGHAPLMAADADAPAAVSPDPAAQEAAEHLPVVTVTARRSEEQAKDVPFTITTFSGEQLEQRRLQSLEEVLRATPGVVVENMEGDTGVNITVRGVGSLYQLGPDSSLIGFNIDGVSLPGRDMSIGTLDVEQIEVLKGPQGTLFGRTSEAGAVNVVTRKPTRVREGHVRADVGRQGQFMQEAAIGGPLSERVSARVAVRNSGYDYWVTNAHTGEPDVKPRDTAFRGRLLWDLTPQTSALLTAERNRSKHKPIASILMPYGESPTIDMEPDAMRANFRAHERYALELKHDLASSRITSITSLVNVDIEATSVYDRDLMRAWLGLDVENALTVGVDGEKTFSQELRWQSLPDSRVFWTTGLYFTDSDSRTFVDSGPLYDVADNNLSHRGYALFGEVTYPVAQKWKLTGGLRHSWDEKSVHYRAVQQRAAFKDNYTTGRLALSYALAPSTNLYGVVSRGYTSGVFKNFTTGLTGGSYDTTPAKASSTLSGELGFKTDLAAHGLSLNGAFFVNRMRDNQLWGFDPMTYGAILFNADTGSHGFELAGTWNPTNRLRLTGALTYTDAEIRSTVLGVNNGDVLAGNRMKDVPRWGGSLGIEYRHPLPGFAGLASPVLRLQGNYSYLGKRPADPQNHFDLKAYGKLDVRVALQAGGAEFSVWADNLLDKSYDLAGYQYTPLARVGNPGRGRTVGLSFAYYF